MSHMSIDMEQFNKCLAEILVLNVKSNPLFFVTLPLNWRSYIILAHKKNENSFVQLPRFFVTLNKLLYLGIKKN